jgi:hypothetical protein
MNHSKHDPPDRYTKESKHESLFKSFTATTWVVLASLAGTVVFYLFVDHKYHLFEALPYVLILGMLLMHVGHGGHNHGDGHSKK